MINTDLFQYQKTLLPQPCLGNTMKVKTLILCYSHLTEAKFTGGTNIFYYTNRQSQTKGDKLFGTQPFFIFETKAILI